MKALTVWQPLANLVIEGVKRVENRSWRTDCRGALAIHAGTSRRALPILNDQAFCRLLEDLGHPAPSKDELVFGAIIGTVHLNDIVPPEDLQDEAFAKGPWCWILDRPRRLDTPRPHKGRRYLWDFHDDLNESAPFVSGPLVGLTDSAPKVPGGGGFTDSRAPSIAVGAFCCATVGRPASLIAGSSPVRVPKVPKFPLYAPSSWPTGLVPNRRSGS